MKLGHPERGARARRTRGLDDALLPLINVVFLLMVFFLMAGRLGGPMPGDADPRSQAEPQALDAAPLQLELRAGGRVALGGLEFPDGELGVRSLAWRGQAVDLRASGDAPADRVLRLLGALRQAGVGEVRLLTVRER